MPSIRRFLDDGTIDLRRSFAQAPDIQRLAAGEILLADYRRLLERLRRGFAVVELQAFEDLPDHAVPRLRAHRSTWRLSHDIGILGGTAPLPARPEDLENAGCLASWSAKLGAHFALAHILECLAHAQARLDACFGRRLVSCLLFNTRPIIDAPCFTWAVDQLIDETSPALDWGETLAGARRTLRTIRHALVDRQGPARADHQGPAPSPGHADAATTENGRSQHDRVPA